jgi:predicted PurR-regulated permease PerM
VLLPVVTTLDTTTRRPLARTSPEQPEGREVGIGALAAVVVVGIVALAVAVFVARVQEAFGLTVAAACLALVTLPIQRRLQRWIGNVASLVVTALATLAGAVALAYVVLRDLRSSAEAVADLVRARLDAVTPGSFADRVVNALQLDTAIDEWLSRVPSIVIVGADGGTDVGRQLFSLLAVVILATFFQSSGGSIVDWVVARWPREQTAPEGAIEDSTDATVGLTSESSTEAASPRAVARALFEDVERRGVAYVRRSLVLAAGVFAVVWSVCVLCEMPGAVALAIWAGAWFVVPALGWVVGLLPLGLLVALEPRPLAWVCLASAVAVAVVVIVVRRRLVEAPTLRLGVAPYVICVGLGVAVAGLGGSFVAIVIGAMACAALTSVHRPGRPPGWRLDPRNARTIAGVVVPTGWRAAVLVAGMLAAGVVLWELLHLVGQAIVWLIIGSLVAIALSRPIALLERRARLSRQAASAVLLGLVGLMLVVVTVAGVEDGARATTTVTERLPEVVADLEDTRLIGGWLRDRDASVWVEEQMNDIPQRLDRARPEEWLPTVGARLVDLFWTALFAMALLLDGPRLLDAVRRRVPARHRRQYTRIMAAMGTALAGYMAGAALIATINATVVFTIAIALGVGLAPILAVWAFVWNFVPQIGGFMGGVPLILFALVAGPMRGLVAGLVYFGYQFIENHVIQPAIIGAAIDVAPWGTLIAALVGGAAAGVVGAVVITPLVGVVRVVRAELARDDFPGTTVRVEQPPSMPDSALV